MKDTGGPAFPGNVAATTNANHEPIVYDSMGQGIAGMTLRDWFAGQAMAAIVSCYRETLIHDKGEETERRHYISFGRSLAIDPNNKTGEYDGCIEIAAEAYLFADAMIEHKRYTEGLSD